MAAVSDKTLRHVIHGEYTSRIYRSNGTPDTSGTHRHDCRKQPREEHYDNSHPVSASLQRFFRGDDRLFSPTALTFECRFDIAR